MAPKSVFLITASEKVLETEIVIIQMVASEKCDSGEESRGFKSNC